MTSVEVFGSIHHNENGYTYIEVRRTYKNRSGEFESDLLPCLHWSRQEKNLLSSLKKGTKICLRGRLECKENQMFVIVEEFTPF